MHPNFSRIILVTFIAVVFSCKKAPQYDYVLLNKDKKLDGEWQLKSAKRKYISYGVQVDAKYVNDTMIIERLQSPGKTVITKSAMKVDLIFNKEGTFRVIEDSNGKIGFGSGSWAFNQRYRGHGDDLIINFQLKECVGLSTLSGFTGVGMGQFTDELKEITKNELRLEFVNETEGTTAEVLEGTYIFTK